LAAGEPVTFVATKVIKNASAEMLLCAHNLCPANRTEPRAAKPYLHYVRSLSRASGKVRNALTAASPSIVLPAFARSLSADWEEKGDLFN